MIDIEATKFYVRHRERYPETEVQAYAEHGFNEFGVEVVPFYWRDDIKAIKDLGPTVGIAGWVDDVSLGLEVLGRPTPDTMDYPEVLADMLGRDISPGKMGDVREHPGVPVFIKPRFIHKLFTGFVWNGDENSRRRVVTVPDDTDIWISHPRKFVSEYRTFILDNKILDCRKYRGSPWLAPDREVVESAVDKLWEMSPRAYCLDFGVTAGGAETLLLEYNDSYAMGHYGLAPTYYARMLSARWKEMVEGSRQPKPFKQIDFYLTKLSKLFNSKGAETGRFQTASENISNGPKWETQDDQERPDRPPRP